MNEATIQSIIEKCDDFKKLIDIVKREAEQVESGRKSLHAQNEVFRQQEANLSKREAGINEKITHNEETLASVDKRFIELEEKRKENEEIERRIAKQKEELILVITEAEKKKSELAVIEVKAQAVKEDEERLARDKEELSKREALVEKERLALRDKSESLGMLELKLKEKQTRLNKMLNFDDI